MQRRTFIKVAGSAISTLALPLRTTLGREPLKRNGPARFQYALASYSLRDYFSFKKGKPQEPLTDGPAIDNIGFLDYCVEHGFDAAELTGYFFKPDGDADYFRKIRHAAYVRGVAISGTAIGNNFTGGKGPRHESEVASALEWVDNAANLGAPHIRFFAGKAKELEGNPGRLEEAVDAVLRCAKEAAPKGIFIGIENHGDLSDDHMMQMMDRVPSGGIGDWVGINLDTGNFVSDDPYAEIERCLPYAVNIQLKASMKTVGGPKFPADLERVAKLIKDSGYQGTVALEYEDEDPYKNIPVFFKKVRDLLE